MPLRVKLLERIGQGGICEVFSALLMGEHGFTKRIAVKVLREEFRQSEGHHRLLIQEARLGAKLDHPNWVSTLSVTSTKEGPMVLLELLEGPNLYDYLEQQTRLHQAASLPFVWVIGLQVLAALFEAQALYGPSFVHGDLTPANIMLLEKGGVKLIDLGVATITPTPGKRGKPAYMSPELHQGKTPDGRSDLFALAVILWEALTLRRLFYSQDEKEIPKKVLKAPVPSLGAWGFKEKGLDLFFKKALEKDPEKRFQSPREMTDAMRQVLPLEGPFFESQLFLEKMREWKAVKDSPSISQGDEAATGHRFAITAKQKHYFQAMIQGSWDLEAEEDWPLCVFKEVAAPKEKSENNTPYPFLLALFLSKITLLRLNVYLQIESPERRTVMAFEEGRLSFAEENHAPSRVGNASQLKKGEKALSELVESLFLLPHGELTLYNLKNPPHHGEALPLNAIFPPIRRGVESRWSGSSLASLTELPIDGMVIWSPDQKTALQILHIKAEECHSDMSSFSDGSSFSDIQRAGQLAQSVFVLAALCGFVRLI